MPTVEYAKSSQATCWKCHSKIREGTLRLKTAVGSYDGYGSDPGYGTSKWMHLRCYRPNRKVTWSWFNGADSISEEDKDRLNKLIEKWNDRPSVGGSGTLSPKKEKKKVEKTVGPIRRSRRHVTARVKEEREVEDSNDEDEKLLKEAIKKSLEDF